jgi:hypothetical protein
MQEVRMETVQTTTQTPNMVLARIDAIIHELYELRSLVVRERPLPVPDLAYELFGVLGQGAWDEYDLDLDWQRFKE